MPTYSISGKSWMPLEESGEFARASKPSEIFVVRRRAFELGMTPPALGDAKHRRINVRLGRAIRTARAPIMVLGVDGRARRGHFWLFSKSDIALVTKMGEVAAAIAAREAEGPTGDYETIELLRKQLGDLQREAGLTMPIRPFVKPQGVEFRRVKKSNRQRAAERVRTPLAPGYISLPDCARASRIMLTTWHNWTRAPKFFLIDRKLDCSTLRGFAHHKHHRPMRCIKIRDFNEIMAKLIEARDGRIVRGGETFYSPPFVARYFELPPGSAAAQTLRNRRPCSSEELGRPIRSIEDGYYLAKRDKLTYGRCFSADDVRKLFRQKPGAEIPPMPEPWAPIADDSADLAAIHEKLDHHHAATIAQHEEIKRAVAEHGNPTKPLSPFARAEAELGIVIDADKRTVTGNGKRIDLSGSAVRWHIFSVVALAFPGPASVEDIRKDYPGEDDEVARRQATWHLNGQLASISMQIKDRTLGKFSE